MAHTRGKKSGDLRRNLRLVLYQKDKVETPQSQVLVAEDEEVIFCSFERGSRNGEGVIFHPVSSDWFDVEVFHGSII